MSNQTTDTIERSSDTSDSVGSTRNSSRRKSSSKEPPSWSELANKATNGTIGSSSGGSVTGRTLGYIAAALTLGFGTSLLPFLAFSIPGGWFTTIFVVTLISSFLGQSDYLSSGLAGAALIGTMTLVTGLLTTVFTLGLNVIIMAMVGAGLGVAGTAIGNKIKDKI